MYTNISGLDDSVPLFLSKKPWIFRFRPSHRPRNSRPLLPLPSSSSSSCASHLTELAAGRSLGSSEFVLCFFHRAFKTEFQVEFELNLFPLQVECSCSPCVRDSQIFFVISSQVLTRPTSPWLRTSSVWWPWSSWRQRSPGHPKCCPTTSRQFEHLTCSSPKLLVKKKGQRPQKNGCVVSVVCLCC